MQSVSSKIWTRVVVSISYDDNHYTTDTSIKFSGISKVVSWSWWRNNNKHVGHKSTPVYFQDFTICLGLPAKKGKERMAFQLDGRNWDILSLLNRSLTNSCIVRFHQSPDYSILPFENLLSTAEKSYI